MSVSSNEDTSIDIKPLFLNGSSSLAVSPDTSEEIIYVVQEIPSGLRLVDGESLKDSSGVMKTGDALKAAILTSTSIGRVVGDNIELTQVEAARAHIVGLLMPVNLVQLKFLHTQKSLQILKPQLLSEIIQLVLP